MVYERKNRYANLHTRLEPFISGHRLTATGTEQITIKVKRLFTWYTIIVTMNPALPTADVSVVPSIARRGVTRFKVPMGTEVSDIMETVQYIKV